MAVTRRYLRAATRSLARSLAVAKARAGDALRKFTSTYDATEPKGRRKAPTPTARSEDQILDANKRAKLTANARDIQRNFAIAGWMIRRHLDYVASFQFHSRTGNVELDMQIEQLMEQWFRPYNCDVAGRHRFENLIRLAEARAVVDGDVGLMKLASGHLQAIESDRIRNPIGVSNGFENWLHGVKVDGAGRALAYSIHRRTSLGTFEQDKIVSAANFCLHGYFDRFDQVRGISPLAAALDPLRDVYEGFTYALAKAKVSQLFAMLITRKALDSPGAVSPEIDPETGEPLDSRGKYSVDFGRGPVLLDMDPNDDAKFLESSTPSTQFQEFSQLMVMVAAKALDIPYSFFDESHTNFFGSRGAWLHYERSCQHKQANLLELLRRLTLWRLTLWLLDGSLTLPKGMTIGDLAWEWVPIGMPWWDPAKEIRGDLMAIAAGLDNPQRITKERGRGDWYDNIDRIAEARAYAKSKNVPLSFNPDALGPDPEPEPEKDQPPKKAKPGKPE